VSQTFSTVQVEWSDAVCRVRFDKPGQLNALDNEMADELAVLFGEVLPNSEARVVVISGNGGTFMAGASLDRLESWRAQPPEAVAKALTTGFTAVMVELTPMPVVAAVDGVAFGIGLDICLAADTVIATDRAVFALPETDVGVVPLGGSTHILAHRVGLGRATRIVMFGEKVPAQRALEWGLVSSVVTPEELDGAVDALVDKLLRRSPGAMRAAKRLLRSTPALTVEEAARAERAEFLACLTAPDVAEGIAAVRERRRPQFARGAV